MVITSVNVATQNLFLVYKGQHPPSPPASSGSPTEEETAEG